MTHPPLQKSLEFQRILVWKCCVSTHIYLSRFTIPFSLSLIVCVLRCVVLLYYISLTFLRFDFRLEQAKQNKLHLSLFLCMNMRDIYTSCSISKHTFCRFHLVHSVETRTKKWISYYTIFYKINLFLFQNHWIYWIFYWIKWFSHSNSRIVFILDYFIIYV